MARLRREIAELFLPDIVGEELKHESEAEALYPEEAQSLSRAVEKRRVEFTLGRTAARRALAKLGVAPQPLAVNPDRSVAWPTSAWGSITHTEGLCIAVAALRRQVSGLGIDAELKSRVEPRLWRMIASEREQAFLSAGESEAEQLLRGALLFSAKESFYKAQFCVTRAWVGFHDVELTLFGSRAEPRASTDNAGTFEIRMLKDVAEGFTQDTRFVGRYTVLEQHVVTGLWLSPR